MVGARKSDSEELQKYNNMLNAFGITLQEMFRIYGNNIKSMNITTNKGYMTDQIHINIRINLKNPVI